MSARINSVLTYGTVLGVFIAFIVGLNVEVLPPSKIAPYGTGVEYQQAISQIVTAFVFAIGWLILCMFIGLAIELTKTPPKSPEDTGGSDK